MHNRGSLAALNKAPTTVGAAELRTSATTPGPGWIFAYVGVAIFCQLALLWSVLAPARGLFRSAAFGTSLALLVLVPGRARVQHPARLFVFVVVAIVTLAVLNPSGSTVASVVVHWCFYLAVLGPVFWVARLEVNESTLVRLLLVLWLFATASSVFGVLQASFPGRFQPALSSMIRPDQVLLIKIASGELVPRPMGLTDLPGGAAAGGFYAALLGLGVTMARPFPYARVVGLLSMVTGAICIYLCQIRAMVVVLAICLVALLGLFVLSGRLSRLAATLAIGAIVVTGGFAAAFELGGQPVTGRLETLVASDPGTVYRANRGQMVATAVTELLPEYPLGAGLGRWGMMNTYFGEWEDYIWAEVQWVGWIIDGGFLMLLAYPAAVLAMLITLLRVALDKNGGDFEIWSAIVFAYGVGTLALTFSYVVFMSTNGVEFWLISAVAVQAGRLRANRLAVRHAEIKA